MTHLSIGSYLAPKFDSTLAEAGKQEGEARALRAHRVQLWKDEADRWLGTLPDGSLFMADDLIATIGLPDVGSSPASNNVVGAWVSAKARRGQIVFTGRMMKSQRVIGHSNLQRVWQVV